MKGKIMEKKIFETSILNLLKAIIYYQLATTPEELFEYSIRKLNYFGAKEGVDEFIAALPEQHSARKFYSKLDNLNNNDFMKIKTIAFIKMIVWEVKNKVFDWKFIQEDEDVAQMAMQVANTDISNVEEFVKNNINLLTKNHNRYKYYFAILYDYIVAQKEIQIADILKKELNLFQEYNFHGIYKSNEDEFYFQDAEDERKQYIDLVNAKIKNKSK